MNEILSFINRFKQSNPAAMEEAFTRGNCYWFAKVLNDRFYFHDGEIMYNPVKGHFAWQVGMRLYDITGEIDGLGFESWFWFKVREPIETERIIRDCIRLEVTP